jgi:transcriptional regulator with XRE-family HTH domain
MSADFWAAEPGQQPERPGQQPRPPGQRPVPDGLHAEQAELPLPVLPGFREMALRRMAGDRRRLVTELAGQRQSAGLSQTEVAARMGTSQSAVARLEAGDADVRATTLERYAAAIGSQITWRLRDGQMQDGRPQGGGRRTPHENAIDRFVPARPATAARPVSPALGGRLRPGRRSG